MSYLERSKLFNSPRLDSRITSANVSKSERWLGYMFSPAIIYCAYATMSGTYLNQFYIDVLKLGSVWGGLFMVLLPIVSKIFDALTNLLMGYIIDRTKTRQGKARPWIFISAPILALAGVLLYCVPKASTTVQAIWVGISYNLYFAFAFTIYNMSQALLVPLSTRNTKQRDGNALFLSIGMSMIPGSMVYMLAPLVLLPWMGVDPSRWALAMSIISAIILPGTLLQYYFTKERLSEDASVTETQNISLFKQLKTCISDKFWLIYMLIWLIYQLQQCLFGTALNFYSNWVLGSYNDGITLTLLNAIGQAPLGIGVFLLWPIAKKYGKRKTLLVGMLMATVGSALVSVAPTNMGSVLGSLALKAFGMLPNYLFPAMMAEAMDHIEWKNGYRCDGLTATFSSVIVTIMGGLSVSIFNSGLSVNGYIPPAADGSWVAQNLGTQSFIVACVAIIPAAAFLAIAVLAFFFKVEDLIPQISADITARHKATAEAAGIEYHSPEELAEMEQAEQDRLAEATRIEELKARCAKKGLSFEEEEAKYQAKLAEKKRKSENKKGER